MAMLLVEQNARAALEIADYAYIIENGRRAVPRAAASSTLACRAAPRKESFRDVKHCKRRKRWLG